MGVCPRWTAAALLALLCATTAPAPVASVSWPVFAQTYFSQLSCGNWQRRYTALHQNTVSGLSPERYMVSVAVEAGVADRVLGIVSQFYFAVLSGRAFTTVTYGNLPSFAAACWSPNINWTHPTELPADVVDPLKYTFKGVRGYEGSRAYERSLAETFHPLYMINKPYEGFGNANLSDYAPKIPYIVSSSNRGQVWQLFHNPYHKQQLYAMGLTPESAVPCAFLFLCQPNEVVATYYAPYWDRLAAANAAGLTIGIHIRVGDQSFSKHDDAAASRMLLEFQHFFACAEAIESAFGKGSLPVTWYLMSESRALRRAAAAKYGKKLITDVDAQNAHPDCSYINKEACNNKAMAEAMQHSIGNMYTFSLAQYHVIGARSGFGKFGAILSARWDHMYIANEAGPACDPVSPATLASISKAWSGL
jgi:hypothetical protein